MNNIAPLFSDEVQLAGWVESHSSGAKITFWLSDSAQLDVFRGLTARKANQAGQRFACVLVEINDDETLAAQIDTSALIAKPGESLQEVAPIGPLCLLAVTLCKDPNFLAWGNFLHAAHARACILEICGMDSRKSLDTNAEAALRFHQRIRKPYNAWLFERNLQKAVTA